MSLSRSTLILQEFKNEHFYSVPKATTPLYVPLKTMNEKLCYSLHGAGNT